MGGNIPRKYTALKAVFEYTIKAMLSSMLDHNPEPPVFMLSNTGLTISHIKQLPTYVTFFCNFALGEQSIIELAPFEHA